MVRKLHDFFPGVVIYILGLAWVTIFLIPTEMQRLDAGILPVKWWSNLISLGMFGLFIIFVSFSFFTQQDLRKRKWQKTFFSNPWGWSLMLGVHIALNFLFRPSSLGFNFAINLLILAIGLTCIFKLSKIFGIAHQTAIILVLVASLAYNWGHQLVNQTYSTKPDIGFAHALALLSLALLPSLSRPSNPRFVLALQGLLFACYFFLAITQLRLPTFIVATFFALSGLWQATSLSKRLLATAATTLVSLAVWVLVVRRSVFVQDGTLNLSGRHVFYEVISASRESGLWLIIGNGPGAARASMLSEIGYSNPHSSLLVLFHDYGLVGVGVVSGLVVSLLFRVHCLAKRSETGLKGLFTSIALVMSFGALSLFAEPVETTVVTLTALVAFFSILVGMRAQQSVRE